MRTAGLRPGDTVRANVRGVTFAARIVDLADELIDGRPIRVEPLCRGITFFHLAPSDIDERLDPPPRKHRRPENGGHHG